MKTMTWLLRREFWEHKGAIFWAPIVVGLAMIVFIGGTLIYNIGAKGVTGNVVVNGHAIDVGMAFNSMSPATQQTLINAMATGYIAVAAPLFMVLTVVAFFYCLGALYDERRDRSILFWKSLPLSDQMTVLSKVLTALAVAPLVTIVVGTITSTVLLLVTCGALALNGAKVFGPLLSTPALYLTPLQLAGMLPVYVLWALPTVGWLLMVSAWARSKVFLWAVGTPILAVVIVKWANFLVGQSLNADWFFQNVLARGLGGLIPGIWLAFEHVRPDQLSGVAHRGLDMGSVFKQSWLTLAGPSVWIGALAGGAMIFAAMRLRRWRDEG